MRSSRLDAGDPELELRVIENDRLTLTFLPGVGGRLLALEVDGWSLLWRNGQFFDDDLRAVRPRREWPAQDGTFATWANVGGSKSWPAPQGWDDADQWPGPPGSVLDSGPWSWSERELADGGIEVTMSSPADERTGLVMERRFRIPPAGLTFEQTITLTNVSERPVSWAAWEVCQVDVSAGAGDPRAAVIVEVDGDSDPINQGDYVGALVTHRRSDRFEIPVQDVVAKRGFTEASGRIAWRGPRGEGISLSFTPQPGAEYPDGGARAEIWLQSPVGAPIEELSGLQPDAYLAELEVLGPLQWLAPGEKATFGIGWMAASGSAPTT